MLIKTFQGHLALLNVQFCFEKVIGPMTGRVKIPTLLNELKFDLKASFFKITMQSNHATILEPPLVYNHVTPLWSTLTSNNILQHQLLEYFALVELFVVMILGSAEDEHCFSTLSFLKSKLHNRLIKHLDWVVRMFAQEHYTLNSFPFGDAMKD
jgi:hypothetical protein